MPVTPLDVVVGVPADLIRRRPDVRRAERQVAAQSARIGVAVSDLYPHISLVGTIGVEAEQFGDLFKTPGSMIGAIGPGVHWDILELRSAGEQRPRAGRTFSGTGLRLSEPVLDAGREVEDAMVVFLRSQEQAQHFDAQRRCRGTNRRNHEGAILSGRGRLHAGVSVRKHSHRATGSIGRVAQGDIALGLIAVYRSLGGGWQIRLGGYSAESEAMPMPMPMLEEMPAPEAKENDIQFQSFLTESAVMKATDAELPQRTTSSAVQPRAYQDRPRGRTRIVMRQVFLIASLAAILSIGLVRLSPADEPSKVAPATLPVQALICPDALLRGCCDSYCPKPLPCITCFCRSCGTDDYCKKPCPWVPCFRGCCTGDCYCCKPCPDLCRPLAADYFTCAQRSAACAESGAFAPFSAQSAVNSDVANGPLIRAEVSPISATPGQPQ